jgi:hypothetical protein
VISVRYGNEYRLVRIPKNPKTRYRPANWHIKNRPWRKVDLSYDETAQLKYLRQSYRDINNYWNFVATSIRNGFVTKID